MSDDQLSYFSEDFDWNMLASQVLLNSTEDKIQLPPPNQCEVIIDDTAWENFHSRHNSASFFKERRYLLKEFQELLEVHQDRKTFILEVGCGSGCTALPILKSNLSAMIIGVDISESAVSHSLKIIQENLGDGTIPSQFLALKVDITEPLLEERLKDEGTTSWLWGHSLALKRETEETSTSSLGISKFGGYFDLVTMIFTLSAIDPQKMPQAVKNLWSVIKPGGKVLFRDYGLYNMAMLRFPQSQRISPALYQRLDGTLAYFFSKEFLVSLFEKEGFLTEECKYCCVKLYNRRKKVEMTRVWIHAKFKKPGGENVQMPFYQEDKVS